MARVHSHPGWTGGNELIGSAAAWRHALHGVPEATHSRSLPAADSAKPRWNPVSARDLTLRSASSVLQARKTLDAADCLSLCPSDEALNCSFRLWTRSVPKTSGESVAGVDGRLSLAPAMAWARSWPAV